MRRLSIVVTCTDRKALPPAPRLQARNLDKTRSVAQRADNWRRRLSAAVDNQLPLDRLYRGEAWAQVAAVTRAAETAGYRPSVWVASAGLGLRPITARACAYSATFRRGLEDSVATDRAEAAEWWVKMAILPGTVTVEALGSRVLWILSEPYADALQQDLRRAGGRGGEMLLIGGATDVPGMTRVRADRGLRPVLGGTAGSLNLRTAAAWLERLSGQELASPKAMARWHRWAEQERQPEQWDRRPQTDEDVIAFLRRELDQEPNLTKTRALRRFRDSGWACEQKRFGDLYARVRGGER